jgi:class 3 adenylate cyclase
LINEHFHALAKIVEQHDGQFVKSLGDGTLSSFPSAKQALKAAVEMQKTVSASDQEPRLGLRIGIHTGDVVQTRGDFFGSVVNKSARITATARAGQIMVSEATRVIVGSSPEFTFTDTLSVMFRGFDGQQVVHRLDWNA